MIEFLDLYPFAIAFTSKCNHASLLYHSKIFSLLIRLKQVYLNLSEKRLLLLTQTQQNPFSLLE